MFINIYCENFNYKKVLEWQSGQRGGKKGRERERLIFLQLRSLSLARSGYSVPDVVLEVLKDTKEEKVGSGLLSPVWVFCFSLVKGVKSR